MATDSQGTRRSYHPSELPDHLTIAIRDARMDPEHEHLDALMETPARFDLPTFLLGLALGLFLGRLIGGFS
jgi:hypothetical protein